MPSCHLEVQVQAINVSFTVAKMTTSGVHILKKKISSILKLYEYNCLIQVIMRFRWVTFTILLKRWSLLLGLNCMWKRTFIYRYYNLKINTFGVGDISRKKSFLTSCENVTILVYICKSFSDVLDLHVAEAAFKLKC